MMTRRFGHVDVMTSSNVCCKQKSWMALPIERLPTRRFPQTALLILYTRHQRDRAVLRVDSTLEALEYSH